MREIKFRGKDLNGQWVYGDLEIHRKDSRRLIHSYNDDGGYNRQYDVDEETIGQFTGLHDKNGREIYEGDIVKDLAEGFSTGRIGYIAFLPQECGFVIVWPKSDSRLGHRNRGGGYDCDPTLEVIGNVYDDKELINNYKRQQNNE